MKETERILCSCIYVLGWGASWLWWETTLEKKKYFGITLYSSFYKSAFENSRRWSACVRICFDFESHTLTLALMALTYSHTHIHSNKFCIYPNSFLLAGLFSTSYNMPCWAWGCLTAYILENSDLFPFFHKSFLSTWNANHNKEKTSIEIILVRVEKRQQQKFRLSSFIYQKFQFIPNTSCRCTSAQQHSFPMNYNSFQRSVVIWMLIHTKRSGIEQIHINIYQENSSTNNKIPNLPLSLVMCIRINYAWWRHRERKKPQLRQAKSNQKFIVCHCIYFHF